MPCFCFGKGGGEGWLFFSSEMWSGGKGVFGVLNSSRVKTCLKKNNRSGGIFEDGGIQGRRSRKTKQGRYPDA